MIRILRTIPGPIWWALGLVVVVAWVAIDHG